MNFFLFILLTAMVYIRPGEVIPALVGWEFFFYLSVPCVLLSFQSILGQLSGRSLKTQPITLCVFLLLPATLISNLVHFDLDIETTKGWSLTIKNIIYYILVISLVNTPSRLRQFLFWLWFFCLASTVLAVLQYHGLIHLNYLETMITSIATESGERESVTRMTGSGLFGDPNDLCAVINTGLILSLYGMSDRLFRLPRLLYGVSSLIFGYALMQTQSRGGFIALVAACGIVLLSRYGWKKAVMLGAAGLPIMLLVFKGRITTISAQEGTAHQRIGMWADGFEFFKSSPIFGIGAGQFSKFTADGHVAHNAYIQTYAEMGLFGGTLFSGAFFLPFGRFTAWAMPA